MNNIWRLLKIELLNFFNVNRMIHTKDKKEKLKLIFLFVLIIISFLSIGAVSYLYNYYMLEAFQILDAVELIPGFMFLAVSFVTFMTTIYKINGILFSYHDYDMLMSLPVSTKTILANRILILYVMNISLTILIMIPCGLAYGIKVKPDLIFYPIFFITLFFIPLFPIIIATLAGTIVIAIASRFKRSNVINIILSFLLCAAIIVISLNANQFDFDLFVSISLQLKDVLYSFYPISRLYINSFYQYDFISLFLFISITLIAFILYLIIFQKSYKAIATGLSTDHTKSNYQVGKLQQNRPLYAIYQKELRRYFSSPMYVLNTSFPLVMILILCVSLFFIDTENIEIFLELPGFAKIFHSYSPFILGGMIGSCCTTSSSISLEGRNLWIMKCSPLTVKEIFISKLLVNLTLTIPCSMICSTLLILNLKPDLIYIPLLYLVPILYSLFSAVIGLLLNLIFPNLNWSNETTAIKQSISPAVSILIVFIVILVPFAAIPLKLKISLMNLSFLWNFMLIVATAILYRILMTKGVQLFHRIN